MTIYVNQQEAEKQFSKLFSKVLEGEEVIISVGGKERARILPYHIPDQNVSINKQSRTPGLLKGKLGDSFFDPLPEEELKAWEKNI